MSEVIPAGPLNLRETLRPGLVAFQRVYRMLRVEPPTDKPRLFTDGHGLAVGTPEGVFVFVVAFTDGQNRGAEPMHAYCIQPEAPDAPAVSPSPAGVYQVGEATPLWTIDARAGGIGLALQRTPLVADCYLVVRVVFPEPENPQTIPDVARKRLEPYLGVLRLALGERVLDVLVTESLLQLDDLGRDKETFLSPSVRNETAYEMVTVQPPRLTASLSLLARIAELRSVDRKGYDRLALALRWYRRAVVPHQPFADRYLSLWVAAEIVGKCPDGKKVRALNERVAARVLPGRTVQEVQAALKLDRLEVLRNAIVHRGLGLDAEQMTDDHERSFLRLQAVVEELLRVELGGKPDGLLECYFDS